MRIVNRWSADHPNHFPLCINLDIKGAYIPCTTFFVPFPLGRGLGNQGSCPTADTDVALAALDRTIRAIWDEERSTQILEPSFFTKGNAISVAAAVAAQGWPKVGEIKGSTWFQLNVYGEKSCCNEAVTPEVVLFAGCVVGVLMPRAPLCFAEGLLLLRSGPHIPSATQ